MERGTICHFTFWCVVHLGGPEASFLVHTSKGFRESIKAYYPSTAGGTAIADLLFGRYNPGGRLPFSWPAHMGQLPNLHHRWITSSYDPLYCFGHGLSYTTFTHNNLHVSQTYDHTRGIQVTLDLTNTGALSGHEIVPVYLQQSYASVLPRAQKLVAFAKVYLEPGETKAVTLTIPPHQLATIPDDILGNAPQVVEVGEYRISVGEQTLSFQINP